MNTARRRLRASLADAFYKADPTLLLEARSYFQEGHWPGMIFSQSDLQQHLDDLITNHRKLCDWLEERLKLEDGKIKQDEYYPNDDGYTVSSKDLIMPMMRSVTLLAWAGPALDELGYAGTSVSIVLTGDDAGMKSGPLTLDTLRPPSVCIGDQRR